MTKFARALFIAASLLGIVVLAHSFFKPGGRPPDVKATQLAPEAELTMFVDDRMNYDLPFARILAEKRIARAKAIGKEHPELAGKARTSVDSMEARLARRAKM
jgi:hypothetical protein